MQLFLEKRVNGTCYASLAKTKLLTICFSIATIYLHGVRCTYHMQLCTGQSSLQVVQGLEPVAGLSDSRLRNLVFGFYTEVFNDINFVCSSLRALIAA